jgi:hypothetical protein
LLVANEKLFSKKERLSVNHSQQGLLQNKEKKMLTELIISNKNFLFKMKKRKALSWQLVMRYSKMKLSSSSPTKSFTTIQSKSGLHGYPADQ